MVLALAQSPLTEAENEMAARLPSRTRELVVFCPGCKTLETLYFNDGRLMSTRKFSQQGTHVLHDCGTEKPCRLYRPS